MIVKNIFTFRSVKFRKAGSDIDKRTGEPYTFGDRYAVKFDKVLEDELLEFEINVSVEETALIEKLQTLKPYQEIVFHLELRVYRDTIRLKIIDVSAIENETEESKHRLKQFKLFNLL